MLDAGVSSRSERAAESLVLALIAVGPFLAASTRALQNGDPIRATRATTRHRQF